MWPTSYSRRSSSDSMIRTAGSPRCAATQSVDTSTSGWAYPRDSIGVTGASGAFSGIGGLRDWGLAARLQREHVGEPFGLVEDPAGAAHDAGERIVGDADRQSHLVRDQEVETPDERAAAGAEDTAVHQVGGQLGRRHLEGPAHGIH